MKNKTFDAVKFMRETRDKLSEKYLKNPRTQEKELVRIREKYKMLKRAGPHKRNVHASA